MLQSSLCREDVCEKNPQFFLLLLLLFTSFCVAPLSGSNATAAKVDVGVILNLDQTVGKISKTCISMAIEDFYSNRDYSTMIVPHFRDSNSDVVAAASAAVDLLKNAHVMAILGPQKSIQADFVIQIGNKVKVPIISTATSPTLSPKDSEYFIRASWCASSQVKAIAAIVNKFRWREVVFVYEDTNYGSALVPFWTEDLRESNALISYQSVISPFASDDQIRLELCKLKEMQTRVYIVHMLPVLASRFFQLVKGEGMMEKGYVWIIADVLTSLLDSMEPKTMEAMQGVIGVKAYIPRSKERNKFTSRWNKRFHNENPDMDRTELDVFGLWAYDSITVLAEAIERVGLTSPDFNGSLDGENLTDLEAIGISKAGEFLLPSIRNHMFKGLSGVFNIRDGELQTSAFGIVNVNHGRENTVGFWSEQCGFSSVKPDDCSSEEEDLDHITWPGKPEGVPKGWEIPRSGKKLRVGVPAKGGFNQFIRVERNDETNKVEAYGFSIAVFEEVMKSMPTVQYEYVDGESAGDYNALVKGIQDKKYDAVVGDVTVTSIRSKYADFTIPYSESGVAIIVPIYHNERKNAWIFMKPLTTGLWLTTGAFFVFTGFVVWVLEHRVNKEFRGPRHKQVGMMFWFSFSTLVFAHREKVESNLTRFVLIIWVFVVLVLQASYTANLTSMLTVDQLQPRITDISDLAKNDEYVGIQEGSFVEGFLESIASDSLRPFNKSKLRRYNTVDEFDEALTNGSKNYGVGAIIDELPYMRLLLNKYCNKYTMIGPIYPTCGLGFAFPKGSPLVPEISRAIVKLKEQERMVEISKEYLEDRKDCTNNTTDGALSTSRSLSVDSFKGLFVIAGVSSSLALAIFLSSFLYENRFILTSTASVKLKLYELAGVFTSEKHVASPDNGGVYAATPAISIPCDEEVTFSEDEGFAVVEMTPTQ